MKISSRPNKPVVFKYENPILLYCESIRNKEVVVSVKVRKVYFSLEKIILEAHNRWVYDENKANHAITFIEKYCKHSKGKWGGKPVLLELWQKALIAGMFGFVDKETGLRKHTKTLLVVARKNGKSTIASAVGLYLMVADGEKGPEIFSIATKKDQAKIIWLESKRMVRKSPTLRKKIKTLVAEMSSDFNDGVFKSLGSDSDSLDGLNPHGALADEIHAWKDQNLYDVIYDGMTAREQPMFFETTTAGTVREAVFDTEYDAASKCIDGVAGFEDERLFPVIYELDKREEWTDPAAHQKANPGLGTIKDRQKLLEKVKRAIANPMLQKNLLCKDFNIRETSSEAWLNFEQLNNEAKFEIQELKPNYGIGGVDLSSTTDLTAACVLFMIPGDNHKYVISMYWLPEDLLETRTKEDRIPYDKWHDLGYLRTTPGKKVNPRFVTEWFLEVQNELGIYLPWIGYDSWSAEMWVQEMQGYFGKDAMDPVIQGKKTLSSPMKSMGADLDAKLVVYNNNPITKWCLSNTSIDVDKNLNIQPCKTKNQKQRIDGMAAILDAYVVLERKFNDYQNML